MKIAVIAASPMTINIFLYDQIIQLSKTYDVTVIANFDESSKHVFSEENINLIPIRIFRKISILNDLKAIYTLLMFFRSNHFDLVYSVTPKAGLLAMVTGYVTQVRCRIHTFTGQVWVTKKGLRRIFLKIMDVFIAKFATQLLADSFSQRQFLIDEHVVRANKIKVLGNGSISGVNLSLFKPSSHSRAKTRKELDIDVNDIVFLYLGRISHDKGILDLIHTFNALSKQYIFIKLLIVGPDEINLYEQISKYTDSEIANLRILKFTDSPERYMNAADVFCLPSYREGFGNVIIESAAVGVPAIGSDIYGIKDAIEDGVTGFLFPAADTYALYLAMEKMILNPNKRLQFGRAARIRAERLYSQKYVTSCFIECVNKAIKNTVNI